jgi:hypothetical protein
MSLFSARATMRPTGHSTSTGKSTRWAVAGPRRTGARVLLVVQARNQVSGPVRATLGSFWNCFWRGGGSGGRRRNRHAEENLEGEKAFEFDRERLWFLVRR